MLLINNIEGWHRKLNSAFQCSHPTLWKFLDKLIKEENNIHSDIIHVMSGRQPPVGKYESLSKTGQILRSFFVKLLFKM
jgi:hypothetical protein